MHKLQELEIIGPHTQQEEGGSNESVASCRLSTCDAKTTEG